METFLIYTPAIVTGAGLISALVAARLLHVHCRNKNILKAVGRRQTNCAGFSQLQNLRRAQSDVGFYAAALAGVPVGVTAVHVWQVHHSLFRFASDNTVLIGSLGIAVTGALLFQTFSALRKTRRQRLKYEAQVAVGRELERLTAKGYRVYHDFPAGQTNLDHIVVGTKGVFAVETMARPNPGANKKNGHALAVEYNGHVLIYPDGRDLNIVGRAQQRANWLSDWLSGALGEPIATRSIVALPGWTVKRTSAKGIPVVNPKQFASLFEHIQPRHLSERMVARITDRLDQKCGNVEKPNDLVVPNRVELSPEIAR